jgi:putative tryptophan/tyrosine transport system substrate-binding protein
MQFDQRNRRGCIALLGGAIIAWPLAALAQVSTRRPLIALLFATSRYGAGFTQRMQELGYMAGRDIDIVHRYIEGDLTRVPAVVDELVRLKPDVMVASNTQAAIAMRQATTTIPIVAVNFTDPVGFGLVASHARPGGNVTGILASVDTLPEKQLALVSEVVRRTVKMGMLLNAGFRAHAIMRKGAEHAAAKLAIKLVPVEVESPDGLDAAFQSMARERVAAVLVLQDPMFIAERRRIAVLATAARLPTMFGFREHVEAGGLMSYGINLHANFRRAADLVDKILKGAKPADLPVELPTKFELVVNMKTAKALGLAVPETFLVHADEVIE